MDVARRSTRSSSASTPSSRSLHPHCDVVQSAGRPAVTRRMLVRPRPSQLSAQPSFLGRLTAGSSALNRRMRGSNPARGALLRTRPWWPGGLQPRAGEGSIPSVRASSPGLLVDRGCQPLKPATRVRIPLGALRGDDAAVVSTAACGRAMPAVRVRTPPAASTLWLSHRNHMRGSGANGNTRGLHP
jgi:hypothetical protein